jgi:predicted GNAT superfamily acetyltransferase
MLSPSQFRIEKLNDIESLRQCIEVQRQAWGFADVDVLPLRMLVVCVRIGGQVLGARDSDGKVIGFLNALPGYRNGKVYLHSHMMGVLPEYQNQGVGRSLKWAQREEALSRGIRLIEWTFDPLEFRNAHFNIELLGVISRKYLVNTYGITSSPLHGGLPTDRLVAEWHLDSPRVTAYRDRETRQAATPCEPCVELPLNLMELRLNQPAHALQFQLEFREKMTSLFRENFCVTGFETNVARQKALYHLQSQVPDILEP